MVVLVAGCTSLPHDGPSARSILETAQEGAPYALVDLDYRVSQIVAAQPAPALGALAPVSSAAPVDLIGEGDILSVQVFQPGMGPASAEDGSSTGDGRQSFPKLAVDRDGRVSVPFAGEVRVAGLTASQAAQAIRAALRGRAVNPQVTVFIEANLANAVTVMGEVRNAGRFPLSANQDRLLDVLAAAGGATKPAADTAVTVVRGAQSVTATLANLMADPRENVRLAPRDQVRVTYRPRKFSTFGAFARASQVAIEDESLSLAGAMSRMGGLDTATANASAVMVFRFERADVVRALGVDKPVVGGRVPVVYRLNLRDPMGYFVANNFEVRADDLIYVPRSDATEVRKFFDLASTVSRVAYDVRVTSVIP
jgi:polysaccharide export outer membrane protein